MPACRGGLSKLSGVAETIGIRTIINRFYTSWSTGQKLRIDVLRAASAIQNCRTEAMGAHLASCDCGHLSEVKFNSCRHRSCPQCQGGRRADWLEQMSRDLLPCGHSHVIFTVPEQLNILWQFNRELFADRLMTAARQSLEELLADPKYLGARPGIISALHTWGRNLSIHPHVHCLVSEGGVDDSGQFVKCPRKILLPAGVLHAVFRGKLCQFLKQAVTSGKLTIPPLMSAAKCHSLLNRMGRTRWNVRIQERYPHGVSVAGYLARYMTGGPISDKRICSVTASSVVFRYRDHRDGLEKQMRVTPHEFLSRWFEHVPPHGLRMIRRSGLYANCCKSVCKAVRAALGGSAGEEAGSGPQAAATQVRGLDPPRCPRCNSCVAVRDVYHPRRERSAEGYVERDRMAQPHPP